MFVYHPTFSTLTISQVSNKYNVSTWKLKGVYIADLEPLYDLASIIKYFGRTIVKFNNSVLGEHQNNYTTKIANAYIVFGLDTWLRNLSYSFALKNYLFGATNITKVSDKSKFVYSGYGMTFNG